MSITSYIKDEIDSLLSAKADTTDTRLSDTRVPTDGSVTDAKLDTGGLSADHVHDGSTNKAYTATEKTKLAGVASGATANSSDASLLARANHTGTQLMATISDSGTILAAKADLVGGVVPTSQIPAISLFQILEVANQAAMLALPIGESYLVKRADNDSRWMIDSSADPSDLANWIIVDVDPSAAVEMVNGQVGNVTLGYADVGADQSGAAASAQAYAIARGHHTGTQTADTITDGTTNKAYTATEKTKLAGIATGATAVTVGAAGSGAGNALSANDATTTNARTPTGHHASHESGGTDAVTLAIAQITGLATALSARLLLPAGVWAATTVYPAGTIVQLPTGGLAFTAAGLTSRSTFDATERAAWTFIPGGHYEKLTASGNWICPTGISTAFFTMGGGGGGGGGGTSAATINAQVGGSGGGGGQRLEWQETALVATTAYAYTHGAAGSGGTGGATGGHPGTNGTDGGDGIFVGPSANTHTAKGGGKGITAAATDTTAALGGGIYGWPGGTNAATAITAGCGGATTIGSVWQGQVAGGGGGGTANATKGGGGGTAATAQGMIVDNNATAGSSATVNGVNGVTATVDSCGGGGGGAGNKLAGVGGNGGNGAPGYLIVRY